MEAYVQHVDLHACRATYWPQLVLAMTHQCTPIVMQARSQNAGSTGMILQLTTLAGWPY